MDNYVLITGASSGIGRQCAIQLSEKYNLILCARREDKLQETRELCQNPEKHLIFVCDLSDIDNLEDNIINFLKEKDITISKFLHCAGDKGISLLNSCSINFIKNCFNINLFSAILIVKVLSSKRHNKKKLKNIVLLSSINTKIPTKATSIYCTSKAAIEAFVKEMAIELAPSVRINAILPGLLASDMTRQIYENDLNINEITSQYPLGSGNFDDIANMVEFLFSDKAKWITGQQIAVDGGASI